MKQRNSFSTSQINYRDIAPLAFAFFAIGGSVLVVFSKQMEWNLWAVLSIPVICLVTYTLLAFTLPRLSLRQDQIGDNVYYLGFLLTLVSLTTTLIQFSSQPDNDFIVSNFGVALVATVVGIFLRTFIGQMRKDVVGIEKEMHASLRDASMRLRSQAFLVIESFASLHKQIAQVTQESSSDISQSHRALAAGLSDIVGEHTDALNQQVTVSVDAISKTTSTIIKDLDLASHALNNSLFNGQKALEESAEHARAILSSFENIKIDYGVLNKVEDSLGKFSKTVEENYASASERINQINQAFSSINIDVAPLALADKSISSFSHSVTQNMSKVTTDFSHQVEALKAASERFSKCSNEIDVNAAKRLQQISEQLERLNQTNSSSLGTKKIAHNKQQDTLEKWHQNPPSQSNYPIK